jgi:pyruvate dehydrogenase E1 component
MLGGLGSRAALVTVLDGHPATLSWLGSVGEFRVSALGVEKFGQSSDIQDAHRLHGIDAGAILDAAAAACLAQMR